MNSLFFYNFISSFFVGCKSSNPSMTENKDIGSFISVNTPQIIIVKDKLLQIVFKPSPTKIVISQMEDGFEVHFLPGQPQSLVPKMCIYHMGFIGYSSTTGSILLFRETRYYFALLLLLNSTVYVRFNG